MFDKWFSMWSSRSQIKLLWTINFWPNRLQINQFEAHMAAPQRLVIVQLKCFEQLFIATCWYAWLLLLLIGKLSIWSNRLQINLLEAHLGNKGWLLNLNVSNSILSVTCQYVHVWIFNAWSEHAGGRGHKFCSWSCFSFHSLASVRLNV